MRQTMLTQSGAPDHVIGWTNFSRTLALNTWFCRNFQYFTGFVCCLFWGYSMSNVTKKMQNLRLISWISLKFWESVVVFKGKFGTNFFLICHVVSELWLSKVLSFPHTQKNCHVHISGDIYAMTMKQVSLESS